MINEPNSETVKRLVSNNAHPGCDPIKDTDTLEALGLDSLDRVELAQELEDAFNIEVGNDDIAKWTDVASILSYLKSVGIE